MSKRPTSLTDAVIVIAGASSGFGRGAALELAAKGARVVVAARRKAVLDELVGEIQAAGGVAVAVETDVSDPQDVAALSKIAIEEFGGSTCGSTMWASAPLASSGIFRSRTMRASSM